MGCIAVTTALLLTQVYFIYNTYQLYERQIYSETKEELSILERRLNSDSIRQTWMSKLKNEAAVKPFTKIRSELHNPYNRELTEKVNQYIMDNPSLKRHEVNYFNKISSAIVTFPNDSSEIIKNVVWYGNYNNKSKVNLLNTYTLSSGSVSSSFGNLTAELNTQSGFTVNNLGKSILLKLISILSFSFFLLLAVVYVFYVSIKNIIKQKKIADVKTDFTNSITHEFNTPLAALNVSLSALKSKTETENDPLVQNAVSTIERQYRRLKDLVNHATQHSLNASDIKLDAVATKNQQFLTDAVSDFVHTHPYIKVSYLPTDAVVTLLVDQFHFTTAINNLLDNAAKYGNGLVVIKSFKENNWYKISVTDNGAGIPKEKLQIIFDKFTRLQRGNIHTVKGLGLGLYYARQIVYAHNGKISVESEHGKGTTFTISIPTT